MTDEAVVQEAPKPKKERKPRQKKRKFNPRHQTLIELSGQINPATGNEYKLIEMARIAGYKGRAAEVNPSRDRKVVPGLLEAMDANAERMRESRARGAEKGQAKAAEKAAFDVEMSLIKLAQIPPERTNNTIGGQVKAHEIIAVMQRKLVRQTHELSEAEMRRSPEDKDFFAKNGYWPEAAKKPESVN